MENSRQPITPEEFSRIWNKIRLDANEKYTVPPEIIKVDDSIIATLGNFSASAGKAKSKKTFNISAIVAAALKNGKVLKYSVSLPADKSKILYVDTEQSRYHCHKVMERIMTLANLPKDIENDRFTFIVLREYTPDVRKAIIEYIIDKDPEIGLVIIDGIRDLMYDINSPSESAELINLLMKWSSTYNLHIHTVLHLNKGDDNTRGHIGTELNNKAETILQISKSNQNGNISEVKVMHIRDKEFDPFAFKINTDALPELVPDYVFKKGGKQNKEADLTEIDVEEHLKALQICFENGSIIGYNNLIAALKSSYAKTGYERGKNAIISLNRFLTDNEFIIREGKRYTLGKQALKYSTLL